MRKISVFLFCLLCFVGILDANDNINDLFLKANNAVEAKNYDKAISIYEEILNQDIVSPELFSNLGHAYFLKKDYPRAKLYFEKGLKLSPYHRDLQLNMKNVDSYLVSDISQLDDFFLLRWWNSWKSLLGSGSWAILSLLSLGLLLFGLSNYLLKWNKLSIKQSFGFIGLGVGLFLLFSLTAKSKHFSENNFEYAILMESIQLKSGPDSRSDDLRELFPGEKMEVLDRIGDWHKVALKNKSTGWVEIKNLSLI